MSSMAGCSAACSRTRCYSNLPKYLRILPRLTAQTLGALAER